LRIELVPLPGHSPDFMPVEALWRWLREDVTYHHCHPTANDLRGCKSFAWVWATGFRSARCLSSLCLMVMR
jgi:transposase